MIVSFKWKILDSDAFEQAFEGVSVTAAIKSWEEFWGLDFNSLERFSFEVEKLS